jgi:hypothetical protein
MKLTIATLISFVAMVLAMAHPFFPSRHTVVNPEEGHIRKGLHGDLL